MPIGAAPVLPGLDDCRIVREHRVARGIAQHFQELRCSQGQPAESPGEQGHKDHGLLTGLSEIKDQADHAPKNVGPAIPARRRQPKATVISKERHV